ncbi:MAG: dTMP kinase [Candidatus Omnitrophica bacterium]|nr:dTMP kinase [Candidatus Omnitrophota bacterium]
MSEKRGFFITLEGPEGSGKSSQARQLVQALRRAGRRVTFVRDPGSTALGRRLRRVLLHADVRGMTPLTEALLFIAGRVQLVEELIKPALAKGRIVVCDRFHDSTMAYQGHGGELDVAWLQVVGRRAIGGLMPDLTLLLDVPTEAGFRRVGRHRDRMERKAQAFHRRLRRGYLALARREPRRIIVIDATQPKTRVAQHVQQIVFKRLRMGRVLPLRDPTVRPRPPTIVGGPAGGRRGPPLRVTRPTEKSYGMV